MRIGTKSLLFGAHQFLVHPFLVFIAWWTLYTFPWDPRLWVMFIVHDWGYWGKRDMDGNDGKYHPILGARIMSFLFDRYKPFVVDTQKEGAYLGEWGLRCLWHSRYMHHRVYIDQCYGRDTYDLYCTLHGAVDEYDLTDFCAADKMALALENTNFYLKRVELTGEIEEYAGEHDHYDWLWRAQDHKLYISLDHKIKKNNDRILDTHHSRQLGLHGTLSSHDTGDATR